MAAKKSSALEVVVAGHICVDLIPDLSHVKLDSPADFFIPGKLLTAGPVSVSTGGPVSNTGLNLIKLGIKTALMGKMGADPFGNMARALLKEQWGVSTGMLTVPDATTSYTVVLTPAGYDRMFLHDPGANNTFCAEDIDYGLVAKARLFHFGYPPIMRRIYEKEGEELVKIFTRARELGVATSLDMSLPDPASESGRVNWRGILEKVVPLVDIFLPSAEEMLFMLDRDNFMRRRSASKSSLIESFTGDDLHRLSDILLGFGAKIVCIKCGPRGYYARTADKKRLAKIKKAPPADLDDFANREFWHPTFHVDEPPNATGAGDSSIAGFLASYLRGLPLDDCVVRAVATGAANVRRPDALSGVLPWRELNDALAAGWRTDPLEVKGAGWRRDPAHPVRWLGPAEKI